MENHFEFVEVEPLAGFTRVKVVVAIPGSYAETVEPLHVRDTSIVTYAVLSTFDKYDGKMKPGILHHLRNP